MMRVRASLTESGLAQYVSAQLNSVFPDARPVAPEALRPLLPEVTRRVEHCFTRVHNKYFFDGKDAIFSHLNGDQYAMFLYLLARVAHCAGADADVPTKLFLLNKALHGIDAYYEVELPSIFLFVHPLGTVLGRGRYSDYLIAYQRCGIGSNHDVYPELGAYTTLRPGAAVLGRSRVGRNCTIAAESLVIDQDLPDDTVYIGNPRDNVMRQDSTLPALWRSDPA
jgi:serine O-acetyltransferase